MGHRVVVAVTLPLLGQGLGLAQGQGQGLGLAPGLGPRDEQGRGISPNPTPAPTSTSAYTTLLPYQDKQREAAELAAMSRARATETSSASGQGLGGGFASRPGLASGSRLGREDKATALSSSTSSSLLTLRRAYSAMWRNTLLSSQPRFQELPVLPLTPTNALKLALALCPEAPVALLTASHALPGDMVALTKYADLSTLRELSNGATTRTGQGLPPPPPSSSSSSSSSLSSSPCYIITRPLSRLPHFTATSLSYHEGLAFVCIATVLGPGLGPGSGLGLGPVQFDLALGWSLCRQVTKPPLPPPPLSSPQSYLSTLPLCTRTLYQPQNISFGYCLPLLISVALVTPSFSSSFSSSPPPHPPTHPPTHFRHLLTIYYVGKPPSMG